MSKKQVYVKGEQFKLSGVAELGMSSHADVSGFAFDGWSGPSGTYSDGQAVTFGSDVTRLSARWRAIDYSLTYLPEGVDHDNPPSYRVSSDAILLSAARRQNYDFVGWYGPDGNAVTSVPHRSLGDRTLSAAFRMRKVDDVGTVMNYSAVDGAQVAFDFAPGFDDVAVMYETSELLQYSVIKSARNCTVKAPAVGTYGQPIEISWEPAVEVGHTPNFVSASVKADGGVLSAYYGNPPVTFTMTGQYYNPVTATAEYDMTANSYTVTLDKAASDAVAGNKTQVTATYDQTMPPLTATGNLPTRTGYTFDGYFLQAVQYYLPTGEPSGTWNIPADATLSARWGKTDLVVTSTSGARYRFASADVPVPFAYADSARKVQPPFSSHPELSDASSLESIEDMTGFVTMIASYAFTGCTNLSNVKLPNCKNIGGNAFNSTVTLDLAGFRGVTHVTENTFYAGGVSIVYVNNDYYEDYWSDDQWNYLIVTDIVYIETR